MEVKDRVLEINDIIVANLNRIIAMRGTTNRAVAEAAGLSHTAVRDIVTYKVRAPTVLTLDRIAKVLNVTLLELLGIEELAGPGIDVIGRVAARARIVKFDGSHNNHPYRVRRPPQLGMTKVIAVVVEGDSLEPIFQAGHVLFFRPMTDDIIGHEDIGKSCIVSDSRGDLSVRLLRTGNAPDRWHLIGLNPTSDTIWDADVAQVSRILFALPVDFVEITP